MAIEITEFTLEDESGELHQYKVNQLPAMKSFKLLQKIMRALGKVEGGFDMSKGEGNAGAMGMAIVGAIGDEAVFEVVDELFKYKLLRDDVKLNPDEVFTGNLTEMFLLIKELVVINWGGLLKGKMLGMLGSLSPQT